MKARLFAWGVVLGLLWALVEFTPPLSNPWSAGALVPTSPVLTTLPVLPPGCKHKDDCL